MNDQQIVEVFSFRAYNGSTKVWRKKRKFFKEGKIKSPSKYYNSEILRKKIATHEAHLNGKTFIEAAKNLEDPKTSEVALLKNGHFYYKDNVYKVSLWSELEKKLGDNPIILTKNKRMVILMKKLEE